MKETNDQYKKNEREIKKEVMEKINKKIYSGDISVNEICDLCYAEPNTVGNWRNRNTIPIFLLYQLHKNKGIDLNCLICGDEKLSNSDSTYIKEELQKFSNFLNEFIHKL